MPARIRAHPVGYPIKPPVEEAELVNLSAGKITSGRFIMARLPDGTVGYFLKAGGAGVDSAYALLAAADIPSLDTAKITTGRFVAARLLDGTAGYFLKAGGAGIDPAYALLAAADIPALDAVKITTGVFDPVRIPDWMFGVPKSIATGAAVVVEADEHLQFITAHSDKVTIDGALQIDGSFIFMDLGG